jgi:hypothetical protein
MLVSLRNRSNVHDLVGLIRDHGYVQFGRVTSNTVLLDDDGVRLLTSRVHATVTSSTDGKLFLTDENSTNGTFVNRGSSETDGQERTADWLRLGPYVPWELQHGDVVGFGGCDRVVDSVTDLTKEVDNPFLFKYEDSADTRPDSYPASSMAKRRRVEALANPGSRETFMEDIGRHMECSICSDLLAGALVLSCGHMFCGVCLAEWLKTGAAQCPDCRRPLLGVPAHCRAVDNLISDALERGRAENGGLVRAAVDRNRRLAAWDSVKDSAPQRWAKLGLKRAQEPEASVS